LQKSWPFYADVFCEPGAFSVAQARTVMEAARKLGLNLRLHVDQLSLSGGAQLAAELGAVTADHSSTLTEKHRGPQGR